jgi:hypothetical protein
MPGVMRQILREGLKSHETIGPLFIGCGSNLLRRLVDTEALLWEGGDVWSQLWSGARPTVEVSNGAFDVEV